MRRLGPAIVAILIGMLSGNVYGQTTRPSNEPWATAVDRFGRVLAEGDPAALAPLLSDDLTVAAFGGRNADAVRLLSRVRGMKLIAARGYTLPAPQVAQDLSEDVAAAQVPEPIKRYMTPPDGGQMAKANLAASKWVAESLGARNGDLVGVLVFWSGRGQGTELMEAGRAEIVFVLVKGVLAGPGPQVQAIMFGDPVAHNRP